MRSERAILLIFAAGYLVLALLFSTGPLFEGPDEIEHYRYIRSVQQNGTLPDAYGRPRGQYHQAPLYYLTMLPLAPLISDGDFTTIDGRLNPYYPHLIGVPGNDNKNLYLHPVAERFPTLESETARSVHTLRLISVLLGLGTVLVSAAIFRLLWPHPDQAFRRHIALAVVAFWPQFAYLSGTLNNDNMLFLLSTVVLYFLLRLQRDGPGNGRAAWLGAAVGAALLSKVAALFLVFPVAFVLLTDRRLWRAIPVAGVMAVAVAGWWYAHNLVVYGDPTNMQAMLQNWQAETIRPGELAPDVGLPRLEYTYRTLWATFGQGAVPVSPLLYAGYDTLTAIALGGGLLLTLRWFVRRQRMNITPLAYRQTGLMLVFGLAWIGALLYLVSTVWSGNQGRYLLPAIAAWGALAGLSLSSVTPRRLQPVVGSVLPALLFGAAFFGAALYFVPAYRSAPVQSAPDRELLWPAGESVELIGVSPETTRAQPGDIVEVTLFWRANGPADADLQMYLHSIDSELVRRDSLPGMGNLLASDWREGMTWAERYTIALPLDATPGSYDLIAGVYDPVIGEAFPATSPLDGDIRIAALVVEN